MFLNCQDYNIINTNTPVLTHKDNGQFKPTDCYFLEIHIKADDETMEKIKIVCKPFVFDAGVRNVIAKHSSEHGNVQRLFLLAGPDIIKNNFQDSNDFLAFALCDDGFKSTEIQYFEVNYKFKHSYEPNQRYRRVGTSALNALKQTYKTRELYGESALEALHFWLKNGFTRTDETGLHLHWNQR